MASAAINRGIRRLGFVVVISLVDQDRRLLNTNLTFGHPRRSANAGEPVLKCHRRVSATFGWPE